MSEKSILSYSFSSAGKNKYYASEVDDFIRSISQNYDTMYRRCKFTDETHFTYVEGSGNDCFYSKITGIKIGEGSGGGAAVSWCESGRRAAEPGVLLR